MTTKLSRPVTRRVETLRGADLIVTLAPEGIRFREPKRRTYFTLPYGSAFMDAVERHVQAERRAKVAAKKQRAADRALLRGPRGITRGR